MVDKKYINTSIAEDLVAIDLEYATISAYNMDELPIVQVIPNKPGVDDINGKYIIAGGVSLDKVTTRKSSKSKVGEITGYRVDRLQLDDEGKVIYDSMNNPTVVETVHVTKVEGLRLVQMMGCQNTYIRTKNLTRKSEDGTLIQSKTTAHLQPYPPKSQAFLKDGRIVLVYDIDEYGNRTTPLTINIDEKACSPKLWKLIQADYLGKKKRQKTRKSASDVKKEQDARLNQLRKSLVMNNRSIINPFQTTIKEDK